MDDESIVLRPPKPNALIFAISFSALMALGVCMILRGEKWGCFFALAAAINALDHVHRLLSPDAYKLVINRKGLEANRLLLGTVRLRWSDIDEFYVGRTGRARRTVVRIRYSRLHHHAPHRTLASAMGVDGVLPNHYGMAEEEFCTLLNAARKRWAQSVRS